MTGERLKQMNGCMKRAKNTLLLTLSSYAYTRVLPRLLSKPPLLTGYPDNSDFHGALPSIALICDEMTWHNFRHECPVVYITPRNWKEAFLGSSKRNISFLFCEAAWLGVNGSHWRGQVYKDGRVCYENRRALLDVLAHCKSAGIPAVFWAKEDPAYFQDDTYGFTDTALHFDFVLTTAAECVARYHVLGHREVHLWPFAFSSALFHPPAKEDAPRERAAVFAGSWFDEHTRRCRDMEALFDMVLEYGIPLRIYDRNRVGGNSDKPFPKRYQPFILDAVPYEKLGDIYRRVDYVININTVCGSDTMFARRVYEAMACGCTVISNDSVGMKKQFGNRVWYTGETFEHKRAKEIQTDNREAVFSAHTWSHRVNQLWEILKA